MAFSRVCVMISIAGGPDWVVCHSKTLQWHHHQRELIQSSHGPSWNVVTTVQSLFGETRVEKWLLVEPICGS
jgi:hypothetical protein